MKAGGKSKAKENPLVPDAVLLRMYDLMVELRSKRRGGRGDEACRAAVAVTLGEADLVGDLLGAAAVKAAAMGSVKAGTPGRLPEVAEAEDRLMLAMGAAAGMRVRPGGGMVVVYARAAEMAARRWEHALGVAGRLLLPVVIVVLPAAETARQGWLSDRAQGWGVPGMPVDGADAVALFRVLQESALRARGGDGPALLEAIQWRLPGEAAAPADGVATMRRLLRTRGLRPSRGRA